jgi:hypothetical protein
MAVMARRSESRPEYDWTDGTAVHRLKKGPASRR